MNLAALIRLLAEKGLSPQDIAEVVEAVQKPETKPRKARERFVPEVWQPNEAHHAKAQTLGITETDFDFLVTSFREWEFKDGKTNFDLAFHRWLRTSAKHGKPATLDFAADRAANRLQALVEGARIASASGRRRWRL